MKIEVRDLKSGELSEMISHRIDYLSEIQGERSQSYKEALRDGLMNYFNQALDAKNIAIKVLTGDGTALSYGAMIIKKIPGDFNKVAYLEGEILNMYTIPSARRKGLSSFVLKELIEEAKRLGVSKLSLHTTRSGEPLYRSFGFSDPQYPVLELVL